VARYVGKHRPREIGRRQLAETRDRVLEETVRQARERILAAASPVEAHTEAWSH
jgi:hypothetical protein